MADEASPSPRTLTAANASAHFGAWRIFFGLFLTYYFVRLLPYAIELYSNEGMWGSARSIPSATLSSLWIESAPTPGWNMRFKLMLFELATPKVVTGAIVSCIVGAALIAVGAFRRGAALFTWVCFAFLFNRNEWSHSPELPYIGWLLLACALIPEGERWSLDGDRQATTPFDWPRYLRGSLWVLLGAGYFTAGWAKVSLEPAWLDGTALGLLFENTSIGHPTASELFGAGPLAAVLVSLTWASLFLQLAFGFLALFRATRMWAWLAMMLIHTGSLITLDLTQVTWGMFFVHLFLFERCAWSDVLARRFPWLAALFLTDLGVRTRQESPVSPNSSSDSEA